MTLHSLIDVPFTINFDDIFDTFETLSTSNTFSTTYPPYDIVKVDDYKYNVEHLLLDLTVMT